MSIPEHELTAMVQREATFRASLARLFYAVGPLQPQERLSEKEDRELYAAYLEAGRVLAHHPPRKEPAHE